MTNNNVRGIRYQEWDLITWGSKELTDAHSGIWDTMGCCI
jgi:hypothetical protein